MSFTRYGITLPFSYYTTFLTIISAKTKQFAGALNRISMITGEFVVIMEGFSNRKNGFSRVGNGFGVMRENFSKTTDGIGGAKDHFSGGKNGFSVVKNGFSGVTDNFSEVKNDFSRSGKLRKSLNNGVFYLKTMLYRDKVEVCNLNLTGSKVRGTNNSFYA